MKNEVIDNNLYKRVVKEYDLYKKILSNGSNVNNLVSSANMQVDNNVTNTLNGEYEKFRDSMDKLNLNIYKIVDCIIHYIYVEKSQLDKNLLWNIYGDIICENIRLNNGDKVIFPFPDENGGITYLNKKYKLKEINL
jgi:hypothetical protein